MADGVAEARRRITAAIAAAWHERARQRIEASPEDHAAALTDAVLDLFEHVKLLDVPYGRRLVLSGPHEPRDVDHATYRTQEIEQP